MRFVRCDGRSEVHPDRLLSRCDSEVSDIRGLGLREVEQGEEPVRMLGYIPGNSATERWLHRRFSGAHQGKKWFRASDDLRAFIAAVGLVETAQAAGKAEECA